MSIFLQRSIAKIAMIYTKISQFDEKLLVYSEDAPMLYFAKVSRTERKEDGHS